MFIDFRIKLNLTYMLETIKLPIMTIWKLERNGANQMLESRQFTDRKRSTKPRNKKLLRNKNEKNKNSFCFNLNNQIKSNFK